MGFVVMPAPRSNPPPCRSFSRPPFSNPRRRRVVQAVSPPVSRAQGRAEAGALYPTFHWPWLPWRSSCSRHRARGRAGRRLQACRRRCTPYHHPFSTRPPRSPSLPCPPRQVWTRSQGDCLNQGMRGAGGRPCPPPLRRACRRCWRGRPPSSPRPRASRCLGWSMASPHSLPATRVLSAWCLHGVRAAPRRAAPQSLPSRPRRGQRARRMGGACSPRLPCPPGL